MAVVLVLVAGLAIAGERSLQASRETSAVQAAQAFASDNTIYQRNWGGFTKVAANMSKPAAGAAADWQHDDELPPTLAAGYDTGTVQSGYKFTYLSAGLFTGTGGTASVATTYDFTAHAIDGKTKDFCSDSTGTFYLPLGTAVANAGAGCLADNLTAVPVGQ